MTTARESARSWWAPGLVQPKARRCSCRSGSMSAAVKASEKEWHLDWPTGLSMVGS